VGFGRVCIYKFVYGGYRLESLVVGLVVILVVILGLDDWGGGCGGVRWSRGLGYDSLVVLLF